MTSWNPEVLFDIERIYLRLIWIPLAKLKGKSNLWRAPAQIGKHLKEKDFVDQSRAPNGWDKLSLGP